ncbi:hypothetical protein BGZ83_011862 [Gryganskiella cystojenkinii]|nr:hypothetical protein BGZ83_011862 [Gryganskiella cystojenkinii]
MDRDKIGEDEARDIVGKMFAEMSNTLNGVGDYPPSSDEHETDEDDTETQKNEDSSCTATGAASTTLGETDEATDEVKKKRRKRKKKKAAKSEIDDFLEESADVALEELEMFDPSKSVAERVELAITRFRKNRKLNPIRGQILSVYLEYGGIKSGPKMFQGGGASSGGLADEGGAPEPDFEAMNTGVDRVDDDENLVVDFTNVVSTFLSQYFLDYTGWVDKVYYTDTPLVIGALLSYFLVRNVLPEHKEDIQQALAITELAKTELPLIKEISPELKGRFDKACSLIYGGEWFGFLKEGQWKEPEYYVDHLGMDMPTAEKIFRSVAGDGVEIRSLSILSKEFRDLEIVRVDMPEIPEPKGQLQLDIAYQKQQAVSSQMDESKTKEDEAINVLSDTFEAATLLNDQPEQQQQQQQQNEPSTPAAVVTEESMEHLNNTRRITEVPVLAKVILKDWDRNVDLEGEDYQRNHGRAEEQSEPEEVHWYFTASMASRLIPGMKMVAQVFTLSNGMSYLEQASLLPTFYLEAEVDESPLGEDEEWEE